MTFSKLHTVLFLALFFAACGCEPGTPADARQPAPTSDAAPAPTASEAIEPLNMDKLKAAAIPEADLVGRVRSSLKTVQREFDKSQGKVPGLGKVTITVNEQFLMTIKNEFGGHVYETQVSLTSLNPENGGMQLIPDLKPEENPGWKVFVLEGKPKVRLSKNGKFTGEKDALEIYLAERANVEQMVPAFVQALKVVHGKYNLDEG